jgi:protein SCO1
MITRRALLASVALVLIAAGARPRRVETRGRRNFPNVPLLTQDNRRVSFYDDLMKDKIVLINFFYATCTGICPAATSNLVKVQALLGDRVGRDIFMYSITLKPREDRPPQLKEYEHMHDIGPGWTLLTGRPEDCELLRRRLGFADIDPVLDRDIKQHTGMVLYGNERFDSWAGCPAQTEASEIVKYVSWMDRGRAAVA